ncbi:unnamed protein product, partial [Mesorhabditis belari]|uniref:C-type lectin domain-containing protein n=1 Tax=Mesorhabditis belari TaxID=2138241 RepID=A0AAF3FA56_9BILA
MDKCLIYSTQSANFDGAVGICESFNGFLISIHNAFENAAIAAFQKESDSPSRFFLIGLQRSPTTDWTWSDDNSTSQFFKWAPGHPGSSSNCAFLATDEQLWHSVDCAQPNAFICELPKKSPCLPGWTYFNYTNMCYYKGEKKSFNQAEIFCRANGGHLTSIHNNVENAFIFEMTYAVSCYNETSQYVEGTVVLGGYYDKSIAGVRQWLDGSDGDYVGDLMCYEPNDNSMILMFSYPINCNDCGNPHGNWYIAADDPKETVFPNFVCKAPAFQ